ncbi:DUF3572 family protein [Rhodophyticola sp. CCM32]|uniref:DUF3572 domain-containing protein n=1 Tax=Rhodophyticola sp. CCM32 TaxID=2916397 RepID=UPI00107FA179|nr:DUF3572 domain-containing protein [Rhodophyticola sp. CCM32]QBY01414.1 DUF3572 family protein [Rhodophyticola sp. CCM32]
MQQETAEKTALKALEWLAADPGLFEVFLGTTGACVADVTARAGDAQFLGAVLDFIMMDDAWVIGCCDAQGIGYEILSQARQSLPGGAVPNWT